MKVNILKSARLDLIEGYWFFEQQSAGWGDYFLTSVDSDIESLPDYAGIHEVVHGFHRAIAEKFPFVIFYRIKGDDLIVHAVLDGRRDPAWIERRLGG